LTIGRARYKISKKLSPLILYTLQTLKNLFDLGNDKVKSKMTSGDWAYAIVMMILQLRMPAATCYCCSCRGFPRTVEREAEKLIKFAEAPSGAHTEETFVDIEEAELDEAWDLNGAEAAPGRKRCF
jgi:hypothetical protein